MDKLNEYLNTLVKVSGSELRLEPNKPPFVMTANGANDISNEMMVGTQISMMVFPIIPNDVKQELPNKPEVSFVLPHNLGNFNFIVKKSPAGFNVTIKPQAKEAVLPTTAPEQPQIEPMQNNLVSTPQIEAHEPASPIIQPTTPIVQSTPMVETPQTFEFESASSTPKYEPQASFQIPNLIVEEDPLEPLQPTSPQIPQVQTASVNDPEFITSFSDTSTYEEPGSKYDFGVEVISEPEEVQSYQTPQSYQSPMVEQIPFVDETPVSQPVAPVQKSFQPTASAQSSFQPAVVNSNAQAKMDKLFYKMAEAKASDLHLSVSMPPMIRKDGRIAVLDQNEAVLEPNSIKELLTSIMPEKNKEEFEQRHDTDFAYAIEDLARFRANIFMDRKGMGGVFRIIPSKILTAQDLGLSKQILDLCNLSKGLVLVTGPTGSGKSTTLCAMIDHINQQRDDHLITIEDPIEFTHENKKCLVNQREVHNHTDSFKDALRAALREDPDILLVGEMRDLETISIAIETAETGHLVFGTLHTTTAISTVDRIIDQFPADRQQQIRVMLSESLKGVIAQTLLPKKGGGRVAALEVLIVTPAISNLIREGKTFQIASAMQTGKAMGMVMLNDALMAHVQSGAVEPRDAYIKAVDKTGFEQLLTRNGFKL
jgi:twitching motility protein PilT